MKSQPRNSAEIREQIRASRRIAAPSGTPMPDDFAAQAQMLADKWHLEDLALELRAALRLERAQVRKLRPAARRRAVAA